MLEYSQIRKKEQKMNLHLKVKTGTLEIVEKIKKLCEDTETAYRVEDYKYFVVCEVNTENTSRLSAIVHTKYDWDGMREHLNLCIYVRDDRSHEVCFSVDYIDALFDL